MEYSSEDMLFALASMGVHVKQTNVPTHRLHRKLTQALGRSQGIPNILKKDLDERATLSNRAENDESSTTSRLVDPSTLKPWASVSNTPLEEVSKDTNPVEALARSMAEKLNATPQGKDVNGTSADPFPLFTNEFNDLRQSVLAIAMRYDRGIKIGMLEDESKMYRIVFRVCCLWFFLVAYSLTFHSRSTKCTHSLPKCHYTSFPTLPRPVHSPLPCVCSYKRLRHQSHTLPKRMVTLSLTSFP